MKKYLKELSVTFTVLCILYGLSCAYFRPALLQHNNPHVGVIKEQGDGKLEN